MLADRQRDAQTRWSHNTLLPFRGGLITDFAVSRYSILLFNSRNESVSHLKCLFTRCVQNVCLFHWHSVCRRHHWSIVMSVMFCVKAFQARYARSNATKYNFVTCEWRSYDRHQVSNMYSKLTNSCIHWYINVTNSSAMAERQRDACSIRVTSSANGTVFSFYCLCRCYLMFLVG